MGSHQLTVLARIPNLMALDMTPYSLVNLSGRDIRHSQSCIAGEVQRSTNSVQVDVGRDVGVHVDGGVGGEDFAEDG